MLGTRTSHTTYRTYDIPVTQRRNEHRGRTAGRKNETLRRPECPDRLWIPSRVIPHGVHGIFYTTDNQPRREIDPSPLPNAEFHNALNYTSIPPYALATHFLIQHTDMPRLTMGFRYEKCVVRRFRRCAKVYTNLDSTA
jgi:hypothetical protein